MAQTFELTPRGPFDLGGQRIRFGGWPELATDPGALATAFAVEDWTTSAAVVLRQPEPSRVSGTVHGATGAAARRAWEQALAVLSLDVDGTGFPAVGERDPVMGRLQESFRHLRPVLFHSPYEAACNFVIGQRISQAQARALRMRMATEIGDSVDVEGVPLAAFPRPQRLLEVRAVRGLPDEKVVRLHGVARAALDGGLDRAHLRSLGIEAALTELTALRGVGPFSAQGILFRGAGVVDEITDDPVSKQAVQRLYGMDHLPRLAEMQRRAEPWRPFRMWALVLLHVWIRGEGGGVSARAGRSGRGARPA